jgi:predicted nucleic acid-binding protein
LTRGWVVDANVGVKLYLSEDLSDLAEDLFQRARRSTNSLFVPDLFYSECANIFWKHVRRSNISPDHAQTSLRELTSLILFTVSTTDLLLNALDLALEYGITAYDASYVALSHELRLPLVTADEKLIRKIEGSGTEVFWLGDLTS